MRFLYLTTLLILLLGVSAAVAQAAPAATDRGKNELKTAAAETLTDKPQRSQRVRPEGEIGRTLATEHKKQRSGDDYKSWKRHLPFWPRKGLILFELMLVISIGVLIGQLIEVSGFVKLLSWLTLPLTGLGNLSRHAGPAFLMALQSGAVANSMLVSQRDSGEICNRELYTSVYVVSALSLFAHLPTFVVPIGIAFGWEATIALFGVRFAAIAIQIVATLLISRLIFARLRIGGRLTVTPQATPVREGRRRRGSFWRTVWQRSRKTLQRLVVYLVPTFAVMTTLEYYGAFEWLAETMPQLFTFDFLPPQSLMVIPAQALSLYNGAIAAANFIDSGAITTHQAVVIILFGSMVTAPIRTLRHALPTYVAVLGARPGLFMAISAQVFRMLFLLLCTCLLMLYWA